MKTQHSDGFDFVMDLTVAIESVAINLGIYVPESIMIHKSCEKRARIYQQLVHERKGTQNLVGLPDKNPSLTKILPKPRTTFGRILADFCKTFQNLGGEDCSLSSPPSHTCL